MFVKYFAVDDGVLDSGRRHHEASSTARQIAAHLATPRGTYRIVVKHYNVRRESRRQPSAVLDAEVVRRLLGDALDRTLERHRTALAHPRPEHVGGVARVAQHIDVRAAVRQSDHRARVADQFGNAILVGIE